MCGIAGVYFKDEAVKVAEPVIKGMCAAIRHRGPDDEGYCLHDNIGLGACRLSVIDLLKGHQPVHNESKAIWVILNGEIYNYQELRKELVDKGHIFYTESDTEVIAHLYEEKQEECVKELSGMFAFAVLNTKNKELFIARDRLGVKPLYYSEQNGSFLFASEIKPIIGFPGFKKRLDLRSFSNFLSMNYVPGPETIFEEIRQLPAGHCLSLKNGNLNIKRYWDLNFNGRDFIGEKEVTERLPCLLRDSVRKMLRSDVPLGAFLSGGMDSSSIVSLISEALEGSIHTFSVSFEEESYDESFFARLAAKDFGTTHHNITYRAADLARDLPRIVWHADNLIADPAQLPLYAVSRLAKEYVTVCLSGDGGDELFMGYPTYTADTYLKHYRGIPGFVRKKLIAGMINLLPVSDRKLSFEYRSKKFVEGAEYPPDKAHYWWRTIFNDEEKRDLFSGDAKREIADTDSYLAYSRHYNDCDGDLFSKFTYADIKVWLADNNLARVDAMSMAHSLEARVPFLDHELVEFMARVPAHLKFKNGIPKYLLKNAMKGKLPQEIVGRKKAGWHVPLAQWFRSDLKEYIKDRIAGSGVFDSGFFRKGSVEGILDAHFKRRQNNAFKIWGLLVFSEWYDAFLANNDRTL